jgi:hypothetical protein
MKLNQYTFRYKRNVPVSEQTDSLCLVVDRQSAYYLVKILMDSIYQGDAGADVTLIGSLVQMEPLFLNPSRE